MSELVALQEFLSSGADVALIVFLYFVWRLDRRILVMEQQIKTLFKTSVVCPLRKTDET